jgi:hypothetical protein
MTLASMPLINDWVNVAAVRSELSVNRPHSEPSAQGCFQLL